MEINHADHEIQVTMWYRWIEHEWLFNHLEMGHCEAMTPTPNCPEQKKAWAGGAKVWRKWLTYADTSVIPMRIL